MSNRTAITAREESSAMDVGNNAGTDPSPPELDDENPISETDTDAETDTDDDARIDDEAEAADEADLVDTDETPGAEQGARFSWTRILACGVLPTVALALVLGDGYLKWLDGSARASRTAAEQSVKAAIDSTIAILSYHPANVERDLKGAADRLTGGFRQQYTQLVSDVVAPGAKQQHISAVATVPAAASVSASENHAVVLAFIDQTTTIGNDAPTQTTSSVRITLERVHDRCLISLFDPV
jgi:Mce-associated membrane protein